MKLLSDDNGIQITLAPADLDKLTLEHMVQGSIDFPGWPILYRVAAVDSPDWDVHFDGHSLVVNIPAPQALAFASNGAGPLETVANGLRVVVDKT